MLANQILTSAQRIDEEDVFNAMNDLLRGLKGFKDRQEHHHDVQPASIYVLDNKSMKLADTYLINDERTGF